MRFVLIAILLCTGCTQLQRLLPGGARLEERLAATVTIVRDEWGVPTIYGETDAAVAFGVGFAQAEDNFWQIEEGYIHALGRASNYYGDQYLAADLVKAAFEVERLAREEYAREPVERKALWDAFAAGMNYYLRVNQQRPRIIARIEPWMPFARYRTITAGTSIDGVLLGDVRSSATSPNSTGEPSNTGALTAKPGFTLVGVWADGASDGSARSNTPTHGSLMWAVAPARTAGGHALLLQSRHVSFFGHDQPYEMHLHSDTGWHVRGFALLGTPIPNVGHNEHIAWSHTTSAADHADVYEVTFDHPSDPLLYRYDGDWRKAESWADTVLVNTASGVQPRVYTFVKTHHGPVVALRDAKSLAIRIARMDEGGAQQQWYAMGRAAHIDEFRTALGQRALADANTLYADRQGNILYVHGNAVPVRDTTFTWTRPLDGSSTRTAWRDYHALSELPQLLNPPSGWLESTDLATFLPAGQRDNSARYPAYMTPITDNPQRDASRRILERDSAWTVDAWAKAAFDTYVTAAERAIAPLVREWEEVGGTNPARAMRLDHSLDRLRAWDRMSTIESVEMTLFTLWQERLRSGTYDDGAYRNFRAFEDVVQRLERDWDSTLVPWGEVNRLQRTRPDVELAFSDERPSLPSAAGPAWAGIVFNVETRPGPGSKRRYGVSGSALSVTELAPQMHARSIVPFGQSADSASSHFLDQAPLYTRAEMKNAWFTRADVLAHARRSYHPGGVQATVR